MNRIVATGLIVLLRSGTAWADASLDADAGATYVATRTEGRLADCEGDIIDRRLSAGLTPTWRSRRGTLSGRAAALAIVQPAGDPEVFDTSANLSYATQAGEHQMDVGAAAGYQNDLHRYGCGSSIDSRLLRNRNLALGTIVKGDGLRTRSASARHSVGRQTSTLTTRYSVRTWEAEESDTRHDLSLQISRAFSSVLAAFAGVRVGAAEGDLDEFADTGVQTGARYRPSRRLNLELQLDANIRDDGGRNFTAGSSARYGMTRQVQTYGQLSSSRGIRVREVSTLGGELGLQVSPPRTELTAAAHYVEFDNAQQSRGKWYTAGATRALTPLQSVGAQLSTGAPFPDQAKETTSWLARYSFRFDKIVRSAQRGGSLRLPLMRTGALSLSYSVSRVVDLVDHEVRIRQWIAAINASF